MLRYTKRKLRFKISLNRIKAPPYRMNFKLEREIDILRLSKQMRLSKLTQAKCPLFVQENAQFSNFIHFFKCRDHSNDCVSDNLGGEGI